MTDKTRYLLMAAGTGGHVFPALALAKALQLEGAHVDWLGTPQGMENRLLANEDITLHQVSMKGFRGKKLLAKLLMPVNLLGSIWQAIKVMRAVKPQVVVGFGGYITLPGGIAAKLLGKKLIIHEQNSVAGSANKLLSGFADQVAVAFPNTLSNEILVGNPVREEIKGLYEMQAKGTLKRVSKILVLGGSLGAQALNTTVPQALAELGLETLPEVWHQTGKGKYDGVVEAYQGYQGQARVDEFIDDMSAAYGWADLIICRAGALTVSEIAVVGLPAIFIPYPFAIDDHQRSNAKWLVDNDAAWMIDQQQLNADSLAELLKKIMNDETVLTQRVNKLNQLAMPDATQKLVEQCQLCTGELNHAA